MSITTSLNSHDDVDLTGEWVKKERKIYLGKTAKDNPKKASKEAYFHWGPGIFLFQF